VTILNALFKAVVRCMGCLFSVIGLNERRSQTPMGRMHELDRWIEALDAVADDALHALEDRGHPGQVADGDMTVGFRDAPVPA